MKFVNLENFKRINFLKSIFLENASYPYIVIDNFLKPKYIKKLNEDFDTIKSDTIYFKYFSVDIKGLTKCNSFSSFFNNLINELYSKTIYSFLKKLGYELFIYEYKRLNKTDLKNLGLENSEFITNAFFINSRFNYNSSFINTSR